MAAKTFEFTLGKATFFPATYKADNQSRKRDPHVDLKLVHEGTTKELGQLASFLSSAPAAETQHLVIGEGEDAWSGYCMIGKSSICPPTNDRAKEQGARACMKLSLDIPDHDQNDLEGLLGTMIAYAEDDETEVQITLQPTQDVLFPAPEDEEQEPEAPAA